MAAQTDRTRRLLTVYQRMRNNRWLNCVGAPAGAGQGGAADSSAFGRKSVGIVVWVDFRTLSPLIWFPAFPRGPLPRTWEPARDGWRARTAASARGRSGRFVRDFPGSAGCGLRRWSTSLPRRRAGEMRRAE